MQTGDPAAVIACAAVINELMPHLLSYWKYGPLDLCSPVRPDARRGTLRKAAGAARNGGDGHPGVRALLPGRGRAAAANDWSCPWQTTAAPSHAARETHREQARMAPGTYYLTKGWIEGRDGASSHATA